MILKSAHSVLETLPTNSSKWPLGFLPFCYINLLVTLHIESESIDKNERKKPTQTYYSTV